MTTGKEAVQATITDERPAVGRAMAYACDWAVLWWMLHAGFWIARYATRFTAAPPGAARAGVVDAGVRLGGETLVVVLACVAAAAVLRASFPSAGSAALRRRENRLGAALSMALVS